MHKPPTDLSDHEAWNEQMAIRYDPDAFITKSGFFVRWIQSLRMKAIVRALACTDDSAVLDVGCGSGNLIERLTARAITGVDISETLLNTARKRLASRSQVTLVKAFAEKLPFPDNHFDRVVCSEVLEHLHNPAAALEEMRRVAKKGAIVVITLPNETLINRTKRIALALHLKKFLAGNYPMSDDMLNAWHRSEIEVDWVKKECAGRFEIIAIDAVPFPFLPYHRIFSLRVQK